MIQRLGHTLSLDRVGGAPHDPGMIRRDHRRAAPDLIMSRIAFTPCAGRDGAVATQDSTSGSSGAMPAKHSQLGFVDRFDLLTIIAIVSISVRAVP